MTALSKLERLDLLYRVLNDKYASAPHAYIAKIRKIQIEVDLLKPRLSTPEEQSAASRVAAKAQALLKIGAPSLAQSSLATTSTVRTPKPSQPALVIPLRAPIPNQLSSLSRSNASQPNYGSFSSQLPPPRQTMVLSSPQAAQSIPLPKDRPAIPKPPPAPITGWGFYSAQQFSRPPPSQRMVLSQKDIENALFDKAQEVILKFKREIQVECWTESWGKALDSLRKVARNGILIHDLRDTCSYLERAIPTSCFRKRDLQDCLFQIKDILRQVDNYRANPSLSEIAFVCSEFFTGCFRKSDTDCMIETCEKVGYVVCCPLICLGKCFFCMVSRGGSQHNQTLTYHHYSSISGSGYGLWWSK